MIVKLSPTMAAMVQCFEWKEEGSGYNNEFLDMKEGPAMILSRAKPLVRVPIPRLYPFGRRCKTSHRKFPNGQLWHP